MRSGVHGGSVMLASYELGTRRASLIAVQHSEHSSSEPIRGGGGLRFKLRHVVMNYACHFPSLFLVCVPHECRKARCAVSA